MPDIFLLVATIYHLLFFPFQELVRKNLLNKAFNESHGFQIFLYVVAALVK